MFTQRSYHNVSYARAPRIPRGWLVGAREATPFFVKDEDILALYAAADLRLRLHDVPDRALLILQRTQRQYVWMKRLTSHALQLHVEDGLRHTHRTSEAHEGVSVEPAGSRTALVPVHNGLHVGQLVKKNVEAPDRPSLHLLVVEVGGK